MKHPSTPPGARRNNQSHNGLACPPGCKLPLAHANHEPIEASSARWILSNFFFHVCPLVWPEVGLKPPTQLVSLEQ
jgi:hypothetical protein